MGFREDDETVLSLSRHTGTFMLSTTDRGLAGRCEADWGPPTEKHERPPGGARWVWRDLPNDLIRLTPRSEAKNEKARAAAKAAYRPDRFRQKGPDSGSARV